MGSSSSQGPTPIDTPKPSDLVGKRKANLDYPRGSVPRGRIQKAYMRIGDDYTSLEQVTEALREAGLESSNLILAIDFTKSNEWTGVKSFNRKSLHDIDNGLNPYQQAISIIGKTLSAFDDDNLIPCYGFGDATTRDDEVFSFKLDDRYCEGFEDALRCYKKLVPNLRLSGPTSFAPAIEMAITIVEKSGGQYHVLVIVADGQVTSNHFGKRGQHSSQELKTVRALVQASNYPLSIILVGVGDGPWDTMKDFDDNLPSREFDNFQFVNFTEIMSKNVPTSRKEAEFALTALMEIPSQYKATIELNLLGRKTLSSLNRIPLPPPSKPLAPRSFDFMQESGKRVRPPESIIRNTESFISSSSFSRSTLRSEELGKRVLPAQNGSSKFPISTDSDSDSTNQSCPICLARPKNMAFSCGHQTCMKCGEQINTCPLCRESITLRIRLY